MMPSKNAWAIAEKIIGQSINPYMAPEIIKRFERVATLIDEGVEKLVGAADALTYHDVGDELLGKEALEGWKVKPNE